MLFIAFFSCATTPPLKESGSVQIVKNVPFFPQKEYQCGPASLSGVFHYWGLQVLPEDIALEVFSESAKGTLDMDMVFYAQKKGFHVSQYKGTLKDIKGHVDSGEPVIVMVDYGFWVYKQNHYMVVVGYDENGIIVNSGEEQLKFIPEEDFKKVWAKTGFWTLLITP